jgi:hypothetical protein
MSQHVPWMLRVEAMTDAERRMADARTAETVRALSGLVRRALALRRRQSRRSSGRASVDHAPRSAPD